MVSFLIGYGFVDFESPSVAQKAVTALKNKGIQAQMAKVNNASIKQYIIIII